MAPEYQDCPEAAPKLGRPLKEVYPGGTRRRRSPALTCDSTPEFARDRLAGRAAMSASPQGPQPVSRGTR